MNLNTIKANAPRLLSGQLPAMIALGVKIAGAVASFGATFLIAAEFGATIVGVYALFTQTLLAFSMFAVFGNDHVIVRGVAGNLANGRELSARRVAARCAVSTFSVAVCFSIACVLLGQMGVTFGIDSELFSPLAIGLVANAALVLGAALLRGTHRVVLSQALTGFVAAAMLVFALCLPYLDLGDPRFALPVAYTIAAVIAGVLACAVALRIGSSWTRDQEAGGDPNTHGQFKLGAISTLNFAVGWIVLVFVGLLFGEAEAGVFRVCMQFNTLLLMVIFTYHSTLSPEYAKRYSLGDYKGMKSLLRQSQLVLAILCGLPALLIFIFAKEVLAIMGDEFIQGETTLRLLIFAALIVALTGSAGALLNMSGREVAVLRVTVLGAVTHLICLFAGAVWLGLEAAAASYVVAFAIKYVTTYVIADRWLARRIATQ